MALEEYAVVDHSLQGASMDASIYDQIFVTRPTTEDIWNCNNDYYCNVISECRVLEEANELLNAASLPALDSEFGTANCIFNGAEIPAFHATFPAPNTAPAVVHGDRRSSENSYGDHRSTSSRWVESENQAIGGYSYAKFGGDFGGGVKDLRKEGSDVTYDEAVSGRESVGPLCSVQNFSLQNELELICGNASGLSRAGSEASGFSVTHLHENLSKNAPGESSCYGTSLNPYEDIEANGRFSCPRAENVISTFLNGDKTSVEPLEMDRPQGVAALPGTKNKDYCGLPLGKWHKTLVHSHGQSLQGCKNSSVINNGTEGQPILRNQEDYKPLIQGDGFKKDDGGQFLFKKPRTDTMTAGEGRQMNAKTVSGSGNKGKGQPAKNLLAERRRRKRLNERLCMLRSVVPTITKMDRTSILSDTIEYTKQLLHQIRYLHQQLQPQTEWPAHLRAYGGYFGSRSSSDQYFADKTIPKFEVHRTDGWHLNIHMACQANPNLLLSTVSALESSGLEIQHGIFSCFSDFGMQAHCSEAHKGKGNTRPEDIKFALLQNAGYLGKND